MPLLPAQDFQSPAFKGMPLADDRHPIGIIVQVVVVGIVSCIPSSPLLSSR